MPLANTTMAVKKYSASENNVKKQSYSKRHSITVVLFFWEL